MELKRLPWSKIQFSHPGQVAVVRNAYRQNDLAYHNFDGHIYTLYDHAYFDQVEYDAALDVAILCHDIVYDGKAFPERRSASMMREIFGDALPEYILSRAEYLIHTTEHHDPCSDNRLIILDLRDLLDHQKALANRKLIKLEHDKLYPEANPASFREKSDTFMLGLADRIEIGLPFVSRLDELDFFQRVIPSIRTLVATK